MTPPTAANQVSTFLPGDRSTSELRVLIVEDEPTDALVVRRLLERGGYTVCSETVSTPDAMAGVLSHGQWDIIISDYNMPGFNAFDALEVAKQRAPEIPFVVLSGAIGEEVAVEIMRQGAQDYILKGNTTRLVPVVRRELADAVVRRQERRMAERVMLFRRLLDYSNDTIFLIRPGTGRLLDANAQASLKLGYARAELLNMSIMDIDVGIRTLTAWRREVDALREQPGTVREGALRPLDGAPVPVEVGLRLADLAEGEFVVAIARDIRDRRRAGHLARSLATEQAAVRRLRELDQLKDDFVSTVSHELRTPVAVASEGLALLAEGVPGAINAGQKRILEIARGSISRLGRLVDDLLDMSKMEAGKLTLHKQRVDFADVVREAVEGIGALADREGLALSWSCEPQPLDIDADRDRMLQVLTNLLSNALKFTERGQITVTARLGGGRVHCAVVDSGCGIKAEHLPRLFEKFVQILPPDRARKRPKGTGLGLCIAQRIVELHGGRIEVRSEVGRGTTFTIDLPQYCEATPLPGEACHEAHIAS